MSVRRSILAAAGALALSAWAADTTSAQAVRQTGRVHQDWQEACEPGSGGELCFIYQQLAYQGRAAANITIGYKKGFDGPVTVINLPLGAVLLPDGLRLETDKGVEGWFPFRFCDVRGCHVEAELEARLLAAMRAGAEAWLIVRDLNSKPVRLRFSLLGLTAGLEALRR